MKSFLSVLKGEGVALLAAIGAAFTLFTGLEAFLEFCKWLQPFVYYWKYYLHLIVDAVFFWLPFSLPLSIKDMFALFVLFTMIIFRVDAQYKALDRERADENRAEDRDRLDFYKRTALVSTGVVLIIFLFPVFGWNPDALTEQVAGLAAVYDKLTSFLPMVARIIAATAVIAFILFASDRHPTQTKIGLFSKHMWRISTLFVALVIVNVVGLYADQVKAWKDSPPLDPPSSVSTARNVCTQRWATTAQCNTSSTAMFP